MAFVSRLSKNMVGYAAACHRQLTEPLRVSENTLDMMDKSMENVKKGKAGGAIDLSKFEK